MLNNDLQNRLLDAVALCMRPLARMLLGAGIGYAQFAEVAKRAFIEQAFGEPDAKGRTTNVFTQGSIASKAAARDTCSK